MISQAALAVCETTRTDRDRLWPVSGRSLLRADLRRQSLLLGPRQYNIARRAVEDTGSTVLRELRTLLNEKAGAQLEGIYRAPDYVRVLGFGTALTRYLTEPWTGKCCAPNAARLGATCNLIVSLFDHLVDALGVTPADILDPRTLAALWMRTSRWQTVKDRRRVPVTDTWLVLCLVAQYFDDVEDITPSEREAPLSKLLLKQIWQMYSAEAASSPVHSQRSSLQRLRIAATPFLVMALPAWFGVCSERRESMMSANMRWVMRFGMAIGWMDDFEDLEHDRMTGHPNRLAGVASIEAARDRAWHLAKTFAELSRRRSSMLNCCPDGLEALLPLLLSSWLGGPDLDAGPARRFDFEWPGAADAVPQPGHRPRTAVPN